MKNMLFLVLAFSTSGVQGDRIEKIDQCGVHCSQGLRCKAKSQLFLGFCKSPPDGITSDVFSNTSVSTVMRCDGRQQCSLHLSISTDLQISEHIHGIYMCTFGAGMMERCRTVSLPRNVREKLVDKQVLPWKQVYVQDDCLEVGAGQEVHVTLKTWPWFCDVAVFRLHHVPDCSNPDIRREVPECITGTIHYEVDAEKKELFVSVSEMLQGKDYHIRLCHKSYLCKGTGEHVLLKKENLLKNATLKYNRPVPCLCIEGWSAMMDAPRVQLCPFKNRVEELWTGITFDPATETLSWEAACPVSGAVTLCELREGGVCEHLANSFQTYVKGQVTYSAVDPHARLCVKFITDAGEWVKCPFLEGDFPAWYLHMTTQEGDPQLLITSRVRARLSLSTCTKTGPNRCENTHTTSIEVEKFKPVQANLTMDICKPRHCIKAKRVDAQYGISTLYCQLPCSTFPAAAPFRSTGTDVEWQVSYLVPVIAMLAMAIMATLVLAIAVMVYQIRRVSRAQGNTCLPGANRGTCSLIPGRPNSETALTRKTLLCEPHSPASSQLRQGDTSNLLDSFTDHFIV